MISKAEWESIEIELKNMYGHAELLVDEYRVDLQMQPISTYRNGIALYINKKIKGEWLYEDCEERRRFIRKRERSLLNKNDLKFIKRMKKKQREEFMERSKYVSYELYWTSFTALKRHLIKNNSEIELVKVNGLLGR